jgi:CheY-like chemotaxis protein
VGISASGSNQQGLKVLVVDDDPLFCEVMEVVLGLKSCVAEIRSAICAADAVEEFRAFRPNVVFVDHIMPWVDGDELGGRLRKMDPSARLLSISGLHGKETPPWADEHVMKSGALFDDLERILRGKIAQG